MRDTQSARAVQEFAIKLERIEAQKAPIVEEKRSIMKMILGKDFNDEDKAEDMRQEFEKQKNREKANLIVNFSIPNTKEDIMEFMLLASSNINPKYGTDDIVSKAWISKLDQVYQKAEMSMRNNPDFAQIKNIYDQHTRVRPLFLYINHDTPACLCVLRFFAANRNAFSIAGVSSAESSSKTISLFAASFICFICSSVGF